MELTNDADTGPEDSAANLYEYDVESGVLHDLTVDDVDSAGAGVLGLVTASEDGTYVYFVAEGELTSEKNAEGEEAVTGQPNLYLTHAGVVTFIATLASSVGRYHEDHLENGDEEDWVGLDDQNFDFGPGRHSARVVGDGSRLVFESVRELTGFDNRPVEPGGCAEEACREVFLFDASSGKLVCVSCDPGFGGRAPARPVGSAELGGHEEEDGSVSGVSAFYLPRNLSGGGGRLFFESPDALVSRDSNGRVDVYEWELPGVGSCSESSPAFSASTGGCVLPVSNVAGGADSHFIDASASGNDVFIATGDQLVPSDTDTREDVYDVRAGGGFPELLPPPVCVNADSCKPPVSPQPGVFGIPASATFSGPGNPVALSPLPAPSRPSTAVQLRSEKLTRALVACRKSYRRSHKHRVACEKTARRKYGNRRS